MENNDPPNQNNNDYPPQPPTNTQPVVITAPIQPKSIQSSGSIIVGASSPEVATPQGSFHKKFSKILIICIVVVILLVVGAWWLLCHDKSKTTSNNTSTSKQVNTSYQGKTIPLLSTANWMSYSSLIYGISMSIPSTWNAEDLPPTNIKASIDPGVQISSPKITLKNAFTGSTESGSFTVLIITSKVPNATNIVYTNNDLLWAFSKCQDFTKVNLFGSSYQLEVTSSDPSTQGTDPYNNPSIFDAFYIGGGCQPPNQISPIGYSFKSNFSVDNSGLKLIASASYSPIPPSSQIGDNYVPFITNSPQVNQNLQDFMTILSTVKTN